MSALSKTRLARLHDALAAHVSPTGVPGIVALVNRRGETHGRRCALALRGEVAVHGRLQVCARAVRLRAALHRRQHDTRQRGEHRNRSIHLTSGNAPEYRRI